MLVGVHAMLAMRTNTPELVIEEVEAKAFLKAAQNVMRHYSVETTQKTLDWIALFGSAGSIWGTRAFAIAARRSAERQAAKAEGGAVLAWPVKPRPRPEAAPAPSAEPVQPPADFAPSVPAGPVEGDEHHGF